MNEKPSNPKDAIATNKTPIHLVSSIATIYASIAQYLGNVKYGAWNWRGAGIRYSIYYSALMRHMFRWWNGEENDPADGTPHLANALCCLNIIIEGMYMKNAADDRPPRVNLDEAMKTVEDLMPKIREKYADKNPKHWSILDPVPSNAVVEHPDRQGKQVRSGSKAAAPKKILQLTRRQRALLVR